MKRLILTLGLLLVSAALLGTSTFAWFSMNKDVNITGMQVKATTPAYIYISSNSDMSGRSNSVAAPSTVTTVVPTSTVDLANWFVGTAATADASTINGTGYVAKTSETVNVAQTYYVQSPNNAVQNLKVKNITITYTDDNASAINPALRIAVKCGDVTLFFAPLSTTNSGTAVKAAGTGADKTDTITFVKIGSTDTSVAKTTNVTYNTKAEGDGNSSVIIADMAADTIYAVQVFVFFDGEDAACTSNNAVTLNTLNVTIGFQAD